MNRRDAETQRRKEEKGEEVRKKSSKFKDLNSQHETRFVHRSFNEGG